jgi:hypothetical protein
MAPIDNFAALTFLVLGVVAVVYLGFEFWRVLG